MPSVSANGSKLKNFETSEACHKLIRRAASVGASCWRIEADLSKFDIGLVVLSMGGERLDTLNALENVLPPSGPFL